MTAKACIVDQNIYIQTKLRDFFVKFLGLLCCAYILGNYMYFYIMTFFYKEIDASFGAKNVSKDLVFLKVQLPFYNCNSRYHKKGKQEHLITLTEVLALYH